MGGVLGGAWQGWGRVPCDLRCTRGMLWGRRRGMVRTIYAVEGEAWRGSHGGDGAGVWFTPYSQCPRYGVHHIASTRMLLRDGHSDDKGEAGQRRQGPTRASTHPHPCRQGRGRGGLEYTSHPWFSGTHLRGWGLRREEPGAPERTCCPYTLQRLGLVGHL